jgi:hypothetical protein
MNKLSRNQHAGASRLEIMVVVFILTIVAGWLLHTMRFYQELAEKTSVEATAMNMRSGLRLKIAELIVKGNLEQQSQFAKKNPVQFLEHLPAGYLGEMKTPGILPPGSWYFDQNSSELVYIPKLSSNLLIETGTSVANGISLRWQIRQPDGSSGFSFVDVELVTSYKWF